MSQLVSPPEIKVGAVYASLYGVRYQVLAMWDEVAWVLKVDRPVKDYAVYQRDVNPTTTSLDFLRQFKMLVDAEDGVARPTSSGRPS